LFEARHDVAVVNATIDLCEGEPVHLIGHSYGGRVGLAAATMRPDRIRSLALYEPTCFGMLRSLEHAHDGLPSCDDDRFAASETSIARFVDYWSGQLGSHASNQRRLERVGAIPMMVLSGAASTRAGRRTCELLATMMPNCQHVELPGLGHMGPLLGPETVNALLLEHIAAIEATWSPAE
jgi:pimeloyl-ACP methyl ester carboxylesterase